MPSGGEVRELEVCRAGEILARGYRRVRFLGATVRERLHDGLAACTREHIGAEQAVDLALRQRDGLLRLRVDGDHEADDLLAGVQRAAAVAFAQLIVRPERLKLDLLARRARREEARLHDAAVVVDLARDQERRGADRGRRVRTVGPIRGTVERVRHRDLQQARVELLAAFQQTRFRAAAFGVGHGDRVGARELHDVKRRHDEAVGSTPDRVAGAELRSCTLLHLDVHEPRRRRIRAEQQNSGKNRTAKSTFVSHHLARSQSSPGRPV